MSRIFNALMAFSILAVTFVVPVNRVEATTVGDLKAELAALEAEQKENSEAKELTEEEIVDTQQNIAATTVAVEETQIEISELAEEIVLLNEDIAEKDEEIKNIVNYFQVSNGEEAYLEYTFGAADFTDFIYRMAVTEQLTDYNDQLIKEFNDMIETNEQNQKDLEEKQIALEDKQKSLEGYLSSLSDSLEEFQDVGTSIEEDIQLSREAIDLYQNELGCADDEDIKLCGKNKLPPETNLWRPTDSGLITSEFDMTRMHPVYNYIKPHYGIDIAKSGSNVPIYSSGNGMVIGTITTATSSAGLTVVIHHEIQGVAYTSVYLHLSQIFVTKGDVVDKNTIIAYMGNTGVGTGQHLHLQIATGHMYKDYYTWSEFNARSFNPRLMVNLPGTWGEYTDRLTEY